MPFNRLTAMLATAVAPMLWGTTYLVFTQTLPVDHPLLVGALRALPAGVLLMLLGPGLPPRDKLLPLLFLGLANIGVFFALLFVAAQRLPGGVAATIMSAQPLVVGLLAWLLLGRKPRPAQLAAALAGSLGVGLLILGPAAKLDAIGVAAALAAALSMAAGTVLIERWGRIGSPLAVAAWQLALGGLVLLPVALFVEGLPPALTARNAVGFAYLIVIGTALGYWLWIRGIGVLGADVTFLSLLSPLTATVLGALVLGEWFSPVQTGGAVLILGATVAGMALSRRGRVAVAQKESPARPGKPAGPAAR
ncbi:ABC transporter permease [Ralstonia sp. A12]|uniref:EamA family transporter n=1 Tax=Ralstonia sp. A12 TaxID=1217052 RepID=UPI0005734B2B|nr:EamA family transporter [Ralstonia sp. A12]KHK57342.1 ABC transporter permease [Ralstonia sp. A12]